MSTRSQFVQIEHGGDGICKLIAIDGQHAEIEYFESPAGPRLRRVRAPVGSLREVELSSETRVFWFDPNVHGWRSGRADGLISAQALKVAEDHYAVRFPNGQAAYIPISELYVRCSAPIEDPTDYLAARVTDTPFFFDGRSQITRYLAAQRAAFGGLTSLASSAVDLLEHQITTVRRVLADPIERYLLADEVGLGKTIEAGILIRQHFLDQPHGAHVLVVVPAHLVQQWQTELLTKFFLATGPTLIVLSEDELSEFDGSLGGISMLVVDEAQRSALRAFDPDPSERKIYDVLRALAESVPRLLLLSGTPVLRQEEGFLAMLHLLDPSGYPLRDREQFRQRIRQRQTIAEATLDLADDASSFFAGDALERLEPLFGDDHRLAALCNDVREQLPRDISSDERIRALRTLRSHLSETYRLHRRLLRTRRNDPRLQMYLPRRTGTIRLEHDDAARREAFDFLDAWRLAALRTEDDQPRQTLTELFSLLVTSALSHPRVLLRHIDARIGLLNRAASQPSSVEVGGVLGIRRAFDGEEALLGERRKLIDEAMNVDSRVQCLITWLRSKGDVKKVIAFVDDPEVADLFSGTLRDALGSTFVLRYDGNAETVHSFEEQQSLAILVCDAAAEEGLNLQRCGAAIVHLDLPLEPARIEQRIGRVDRLEARGRMRNVIFRAKCPFESEWLKCVAETIRVFDRSIAPLQYVLAESTRRIRSDLLVEGRAAIEREIARMSDRESGLDAELRRIQAQEALDSVEGNSDADAAFCTALSEADEAAETDGEKALNSWVTDRLQFVCRRLEPDILQYMHDLRRPTLIPLFETFRRFGACLDRAGKERDLRTLPLQPATFNRSTAETKHVTLLRVGHPFVNALEGLIRSDDRGTAFAMWRYVPNCLEAPQVFFRFDWLIESDLSRVRSEFGDRISLDSMRRRADEAFPVEYRTVWLNGDLEPVVDQGVLALLERPYQKSGRADGSKDANVRLERWSRVDALLATSDWGDLCRRARGVAERVVRSDADFLERCRYHAAQARDRANVVNESLKSRIARLSGSAQTSEEEMASIELRLSETLARGIEAPYFRVDSAGAVFLAPQPLEEA